MKVKIRFVYGDRETVLEQPREYIPRIGDMVFLGTPVQQAPPELWVPDGMYGVGAVGWDFRQPEVTVKVMLEDLDSADFKTLKSQLKQVGR